MSLSDPRALRDAFGRFMTGVTVVTARDRSGNLVGFTANSFTSVSLDPPLILVCPGKFLSSYAAFEGCSHFAVNILAEGQEDISNTFAGFKGDRFARTPHHIDDNGCALIDGAVATFSCKRHDWVNAGDHGLLIGQVTAFTTDDKRGLGYAGGQYFSLGLERGARDPEAKINVAGAIITAGDQLWLTQTPRGLAPLQCTLPDRRALRGSLRDHLATLGITAQLGPVFSVFDDPKTDTHYAYLLAEAPAGVAPVGITALPICALDDAAFDGPATTRMMARFAHEAQTRNFTLYLGDAEDGEFHAFTSN